jgi:hypothetical protein
MPEVGNVVLEKKGKCQLDRSREKISITYSRRGEEYSTHNEKK